MNQTKVYGMIPARMGSTRLTEKNLAVLGDKPLIVHAIEAAKKAKIFDRIIVNSEHLDFRRIAKKHGVEFYQRTPDLAQSESLSDDVINDFLIEHECDIVVWVNTTAPLMTGEVLRDAVEYLKKSDYDTLMPFRKEQFHCLLDGKPLNFNPEESFARSQNMKTVQVNTYAFMMWKTKKFLEEYNRRGYAMLAGDVGYFPISRLVSLVVKNEEDFKLVQYVYTGMQMNKDMEISYYKEK